MNKKILSITLVLFVGASVISVPPAAFGQAMQEPVPPADSLETGNTVSATPMNDGINWVWFLPLLLIPVVLLLGRSRNEDGSSEYRHHRFAGTKGGEAQRIRERDIEEILYDLE